LTFEMVIINFVSNFFFFGFTNIMMGLSNTVMITPIRIIIINLSGLTFLIRKKVQIFVFMNILCLNYLLMFLF